MLPASLLPQHDSKVQTACTSNFNFKAKIQMALSHICRNGRRPKVYHAGDAMLLVEVQFGGDILAMSAAHGELLLIAIRGTDRVIVRLQSSNFCRLWL